MATTRRTNPVGSETAPGAEGAASTDPPPDDSVITPTAAGVAAAAAIGREKPFAAATVRKWTREDALPADQTDDGDRITIRYSDFMGWLKEKFGIGAEPESKTEPEPPQATRLNPHRRSGSGASKPASQVQEIDCPECGATLLVTEDTATAICPECEEEIDVLEDDEECDCRNCRIEARKGDHHRRGR
jgi:hypothetical protein